MIKRESIRTNWNGKEVVVYDLIDGTEGYELGYAISIDGKLEYLVSIYEPQGCSVNSKRGLFTCHGHEEIIKVWLDDGEFEEEYTR